MLDREVGRLALDELLAVLVVDLGRARVGATGTGQGCRGRAVGAGLRLAVRVALTLRYFSFERSFFVFFTRASTVSSEPLACAISSLKAETWLGLGVGVGLPSSR